MSVSRAKKVTGFSRKRLRKLKYGAKCRYGGPKRACSCQHIALDSGFEELLYIGDQPEMLKNIAADVAVMLFRNEGNFDFEDRKWMFSDETGKLV